MGNRQLPFDPAAVRRVLGSPEGQQILQLLNQDGGQALKKAADALRAGDAETARQVLSPIMESEAAAGLIDKLNQPR